MMPNIPRLVNIWVRSQVGPGLKTNPVTYSGNIRINVLKKDDVSGFPKIPKEKDRQIQQITTPHETSGEVPKEVQIRPDQLYIEGTIQAV